MCETLSVRIAKVRFVLVFRVTSRVSVLAAAFWYRQVMRVLSCLTISNVGGSARFTCMSLKELVSAQKPCKASTKESLCGRCTGVLCQLRSAKLLLAVGHVLRVYMLPLPCCLLPCCILPAGDSPVPTHSPSSFSSYDRHTLGATHFCIFMIEIQLVLYLKDVLKSLARWVDDVPKNLKWSHHVISDWHRRRIAQGRWGCEHKAWGCSCSGSWMSDNRNHCNV